MTQLRAKMLAKRQIRQPAQDQQLSNSSRRVQMDFGAFCGLGLLSCRARPRPSLLTRHRWPGTLGGFGQCCECVRIGIYRDILGDGASWARAWTGNGAWRCQLQDFLPKPAMLQLNHCMLWRCHKHSIPTCTAWILHCCAQERLQAMDWACASFDPCCSAEAQDVIRLPCCCRHSRCRP